MKIMLNYVHQHHHVAEFKNKVKLVLQYLYNIFIIMNVYNLVLKENIIHKQLKNVMMKYLHAHKQIY